MVFSEGTKLGAVPQFIISVHHFAVEESCFFAMILQQLQSDPESSLSAIIDVTCGTRTTFFFLHLDAN